MASFGERMIGAARLDVHAYEEVEMDATAFSQAMVVVTLSSVAAGIGVAREAGAPGLLGGLIAALLGWFLWAWLTYFIGTRILPEAQTHADWGQLLRTTGFAATPGIVRILGIVPGLTALVFFAASLWMLAAFVIAVRQALDYTSTWRAVGVCLIGWVVNAGVLLALRFLVLG